MIKLARMFTGYYRDHRGILLRSGLVVQTGSLRAGRLQNGSSTRIPADGIGQKVVTKYTPPWCLRIVVSIVEGSPGRTL